MGVHKFKIPIMSEQMPLKDYIHLNFMQAEKYSHDLGGLFKVALQGPEAGR